MATWIIGGIIIGAMVLAAYKAYKNHKNSGCGCGCSGCSQTDKCHK